MRWNLLTAFLDEDRFLLLGYSFQARCLIVSHCYRQSCRNPADLRHARQLFQKMAAEMGMP